MSDSFIVKSVNELASNEYLFGIIQHTIQTKYVA